MLHKALVAKIPVIDTDLQARSRPFLLL